MRHLTARAVGAIVGTLSLILVACDGQSLPTTTTTTLSAFEGGCRITVTGDVEHTWSAPDEGAAFSTDHWRSEAQLRAQYEMLAIQGDPTFEEIQADGLAVLSYFVLTCTGERGDSVSLFVSDVTTRTDMPMEPGVYSISGGLFGAGDMPPAELSATYQPAGGATFGEEGTGILSIDVWDGTRIRGTFRFVAEERFVGEPRVVEVAGTFDFTCTDAEGCG